MPIEYELLFGKVITKSGQEIKLAKGELTEDKNGFEVESLSGLKFYIPIVGGVQTVNCVQRTYKPKEDSNFIKLIAYNL